MKPFVSPAEFYSARDSRTQLCAGTTSFQDVRIALSIEPAEAEHGDGQAAFLLAANLMARWARRVSLHAPRVRLLGCVGPLAGMELGDLAECALRVMRRADPFGGFDEDSNPASIRIHIGTRPPPEAFGVVGRGWVAFGGRELGSAPAASASHFQGGALLAACLGVGVAFRRAIGDVLVPSGFRLSLWNLRGGGAAADGPGATGGQLGRVLVVGCGAVGSSIAFLAPALGLEASFALVDGDLVDTSNLNRSPLFDVESIGRNKAEVVSEYLVRAGLPAMPHRVWLHEVLAQAFHPRPDLVVPVANEHAARLLVQEQVPPLQIYGTTGQDWQAFLGRHIPLVEDCLLCRFPEKEGPPPALACATGTVSGGGPQEKRIDAALPFLSATAALMAVCEMVKAAGGSLPVHPNYACLDLRGPLEDFLLTSAQRKAACRCGRQRVVWGALNGSTRHARLSLGDSLPRRWE